MGHASNFLRRHGVTLALVLVLVAGTVLQPGFFLKPENIRNLLNQNAGVGILAVGMTLVIIGGGIDLSVGSLLALAAACGMTVMNARIGAGSGEAAGVAMGLVVSLLVGLGGGFVNGLLVVLGRVPPFVATLCGLVGYRSLTLAMAQGGEIRSQSPELLPAIGQGGVPIPFFLDNVGRPVVLTWNIFEWLLVALFGSWLLARTAPGRATLAIGGNESATHLAGVNVGRVKIFTYSLMGLLCGLASIGIAARFNSVSTSQMAQFNELDAIAAVAIGGTSLSGGRGSVWKTVVGVLILGVINNMLITSGVSTYWQGLVKGAIILLAVLIQRGGTEQ